MNITRDRLAKCICAVFMLLLVSCGGGSSGGGDNQPATSMTWDEGQWNEVNWQ